MNPLKWFRWKIVIALGAIGAGLYFLGLNPLAKREINSLGSSGAAGARFSVERVGLALAQGRASFDDLKLATPRRVPPQDEAKQRVAEAAGVVCDLGMEDLLRRRFGIDEMSIKKPLLKIERRADGTINVGDLGGTEEEKPAGSPTDWVKAIGEWAEKLKKRAEARRKSQSEKKGPGGPREKKEKGVQADYSREIAYPFEKNPRFLIRKLSAEALEIQFEDQTGKVRPPPILNGKLEILNLSDRPEWLEEPIRISISGEIEKAPIEISATIDLRTIAETGTEKNDLLFHVKAKGLPLDKVVQAFAGDSLDATFEKGTADLDAAVNLLDLEKLAIRGWEGGPLFALHGVEMKSKPGAKIAGLDGEQFARAVNEVGDLEIPDLEIVGTLSRPEFHWGNTIRDLVTSGGKAFAKKQAEKGIEKGTELINKQLKGKTGEQLKAILPEGILGKKPAATKKP